MPDQMETELSNAVEADVKHAAKSRVLPLNQTIGQTFGQPTTPAAVRTQQERIRELADMHQRMADDIAKLETTADLIDKRIAALRTRAL